MIKPLGERLLVRQKVDGEEVSTVSGIVLTPIKKKHPRGIIVELGDGERVGNGKLQVGDEVLFESWGGEPIDKELTGEENILMISFDKVIGIIKYAERV